LYFAMPRALQGSTGYPHAAVGKGRSKGSKSGRAEEQKENEAPLPTHCMGEAGRDHLQSCFGDGPLAQKIIKSIREEGFCVLPRVFTGAEMDAELDRAWDFVQKVSPSVKRNDLRTWWGGRGAPDPWPHAQRDMMQLHQAGWLFSELRERFAERVFEPLYGTQELHVSKDGFTFQRPTDRDLRRTPNDHFDQGNRWMGLQCLQGSVALTDQSDNDGCFQVWPGSHKHREDILSHPKHTKTGRTDFIIIDDNDKDILRERGVNPLRVPVKRGDVILWRSDVCHCGAPPLGRCDSYRAVVYVCCMPAALTPEPVYQQKRRAYERLETGCHYPTREEWFEVVERHKRIAWRPYFTSPPKLTRRQQELYGLVRYGEPQPEEEEEAARARTEDDAKVTESSSGQPAESKTGALDTVAFPPLGQATQTKSDGASRRRWGKR